MLASGLGQSLIDTSGPHNLDTKKSNLGLIGIDPFFEVDSNTITETFDVFGLFGALSAQLSDGLHHGFLELSEPKFDLVFALDGLDQSDGLFGTSQILGDGHDLEDLGTTFLGLVVLELDGVDGIEELVTEELGDGSWVGTLGQNDQQHLFGDEEESREIESLDLEIVLQGPLTVLEMLLKLWEE